MIYQRKKIYIRIILVAVGDESKTPTSVNNDIIVIRSQAILHVGQTDLDLLEIRVDTISHTTEVGHEPDAVTNTDRRRVLLLNEK